MGKGSAGWTSTRPGGGPGGITTPPCRCWPWPSWWCRSTGWGKKEPQMTVPEVRALLGHLLDVRTWDVAEILRWSRWRQERNRRAGIENVAAAVGFAAAAAELMGDSTGAGPVASALASAAASRVESTDTSLPPVLGVSTLILPRSDLWPGSFCG